MNYKNIFRKHMEPMLMRLIYVDLVDGILKDAEITNRRKLQDACGRQFEGGPRAYYCPECRRERMLKANRESKARTRKGTTRKLGSIDACERCGKDYKIASALQRFCPECRPIHSAEHDRETWIQFYHKNKDRINPARNDRRRIEPTRECVVCDTVFEHKGTTSLTCSHDCSRAYINKNWNEVYGPRYREKKNARKKED
ncbi:hypothetical protein [Paenibacillus ginsengarvi]|uniref:Uncharacterized protein n=1 Tax=Paenibacillus ginsengarvi TaxID=400777 RepID=A0A3B0BR79_9BACL|nr:hypothetical protein [Paenibacillus ginsengarvi]RKN74981.1 hypothetical protein D7M11_25925 [Paenibacillus ginsengarvi]